MNVYEIGPVLELSKSMQRWVRGHVAIVERYWYIIAQLLDDVVAEQEIIIDKYGVGKPYQLRVVAILAGKEAPNRARMNSYALLICDPHNFATAKHRDEIVLALASGSKMLS
jgi:hypothetical protein